MATNQPKVTDNAVATQTPAPAASATAATAPVSAPKTMLAPLKVGEIYSPSNVRQVLSGNVNDFKSMKLGKLQETLAGGIAQAETNRNEIMRGPGATKALGVLQGEAAYQNALDTARINAVSGLYTAKEAEYQRQQAEIAPYKTAFMNEFGYMPENMGSKEKAMIEQRYKEKYNMSVAEHNKKMSEGGTGTGSTKAVTNLNALLEKAAQKPEGGREWAVSVAKTFGVNPDDVVAATAQDRWEDAFRTPLTPAQQAEKEASKPNPEKTNATLNLLDDAIKSAKEHSDSSGSTGILSSAKRWVFGADDYTNLTAEANTIRANMLTLATDPTIKKFFGPQMSNADVQLMTSAGTMLNPELQTPDKLKESLKQAEDLVRRAREAVKVGVERENLSGQTGNGNQWQATSNILPSGNSFTVTYKPQ